MPKKDASMKLLSILLIAVAIVTLLPGCDSAGDDSHLTPRQRAMTHGSYDPQYGESIY
jgi:hypothetical protein